MRFDILVPDKNNVEASIQTLGDTVAPMFAKSWVQTGGPMYNHPFNLHVQSFIMSWLQGMTKIFIAYDNSNQSIGFIIGVLYRPLQFECNVLQIECQYYETPEVEKGLLDYLVNSMRFFAVEEVWYTKTKGMSPLELNGWKEKEPLELHRLVK